MTQPTPPAPALRGSEEATAEGISNVIAANFRKFPEALLNQLELRLDATAQYFDDLTPTLRTIWRRLLQRRKTPPTTPAPQWLKQKQKATRELARKVRAALLELPLTAGCARRAA